MLLQGWSLSWRDAVQRGSPSVRPAILVQRTAARRSGSRILGCGCIIINIYMCIYICIYM